jgi:hypothetical protein
MRVRNLVRKSVTSFLEVSDDTEGGGKRHAARRKGETFGAKGGDVVKTHPWVVVGIGSPMHL